MRTLTVVTWFCSEYFDFLLALSFPASLSSRAAAFLYACARLLLCSCAGCVRLCSCARGGGGGGIAERGDVWRGGTAAVLLGWRARTHICTHARIHIHTHKHSPTHTRARAYIQTHACAHTHTNRHIHKHTRTLTYTQTQPRRYTHPRTHTYTGTYALTDTHTRIHIQIDIPYFLERAPLDNKYLIERPPLG